MKVWSGGRNVGGKRSVTISGVNLLHFTDSKASKKKKKMPKKNYKSELQWRLDFDRKEIDKIDLPTDMTFN